MYKVLFRHLISKTIEFKNKQFFLNKLDSKKLSKAIFLLEKYSMESSQPIIFLIYAYIYYYVVVFNNSNYNQIYLQVPKFIDLFRQSNLPIFTIEDSKEVLELCNIWNEMHFLNSLDFPFHLRKVISDSKIKIRKNTYFQHTFNYITFFRIIHNINKERKYYPKIHGFIEFFLHLPVITGWARNYTLYEYINLGKLDKYYRKVYDNIDKEKRLAKFLKEIQITKENLEIYKKSKIFGAQDAIIYIEDRLKNEEKVVCSV